MSRIREGAVLARSSLGPAAFALGLAKIFFFFFPHRSIRRQRAAQRRDRARSADAYGMSSVVPRSARVKPSRAMEATADCLRNTLRFAYHAGPTAVRSARPLGTRRSANLSSTFIVEVNWRVDNLCANTPCCSIRPSSAGETQRAAPPSQAPEAGVA